MKKILSIMMASLLLLLSGCSSSDDEASALKIEKSTTSFSAMGGTGTISYSALGTVKVSSSNPDWLAINSTADGQVLFTVSANNAIMSRNATITIGQGSVSYNVTVSQLGGILDIAYNALTIGAASRDYTFELYTNISEADLTVTTTDDWLKVWVEAGLLHVLPQTNLSDARNTTLKIKTQWKSIELPVSQHSFLDKKAIEFMKSGTPVTINIAESIADVGSTWEATAAESWIHVSIDNFVITVTADGNATGAPRNGSFVFTCGTDVSIEIPVLQHSYDNLYEHFLGEWTITYQNDKNIAAYFDEDVPNESYKMRIGSSDHQVVPVKYDAATGMLTIYNLQNNGKVYKKSGKDYYVYTFTVAYKPEKGTFLFNTANTAIGLNLIYDGNEVGSKLMPEDNGVAVWGGTYKTDGISFRGSTSDSGFDKNGAIGISACLDIKRFVKK